jgi:hypothetical protein
MVIVTDQQLQDLGTKALMAVGVAQDEAAWVTDCLVRANIKGVDSHGIQLLRVYVPQVQKGIIQPGANLRLLRERVASALFDGGSGFGYTMAREAMQVTLTKAERVNYRSPPLRSLFPRDSTSPSSWICRWARSRGIAPTSWQHGDKRCPSAGS